MNKTNDPPWSTVESCKELKYLDLRNNTLREISPDWEKCLLKLEILNLSYNKLTQLEVGTPWRVGNLRMSYTRFFSRFFQLFFASTSYVHPLKNSQTLLITLIAGIDSATVNFFQGWIKIVSCSKRLFFFFQSVSRLVTTSYNLGMTIRPNYHLLRYTWMEITSVRLHSLT